MMLAFSIGGTKRQALKGLGIHENRQQLLIQGMQGFVRMNTGVGERLPAAVLPHRLILMQVFLNISSHRQCYGTGSVENE